MKQFLKSLTPPIVLDAVRTARGATAAHAGQAEGRSFDPTGKTQELGVYSTDAMEAALEVWGRGNAWDEIQCLFAGRSGAALDIACGTGVNMLDLAKNPGLDLYGIDIEPRLIAAAGRRGISAAKLKVGDATKLPYDNQFFDYSYSIGSLEHFTVDGIPAFIAECARVTKTTSFHMMPVSNSGQDEGWMQTNQSFWNMSPRWWVDHFSKQFARVVTMESKWRCGYGRSYGMWFVCSHGESPVSTPRLDSAAASG